MNALRSKCRIAVLCAIAVTATAAAQEQEKKKPLSPPASASVQLGGASVKVDYSAPSMRGRTIMGALVPYDKWWRTGANAATALTTSADLDINGTKVPMGSYTLFTLPSAGAWKLIVSKDTGEFGTKYDESKDFARIDMKKDALSSAQETMSISFEKTHGNSTQLHVRWEHVDAWVPVTAK